MKDIKAYKPESNSFSSGQVLQEPYEFVKGKLVAREMTDQLVLDVPEEQEVWMLCLRLAVMRRDGDEVHRVIDAIDKQHVYLSADNREKLAFWRDGEEAR